MTAGALVLLIVAVTSAACNRQQDATPPANSAESSAQSSSSAGSSDPADAEAPLPAAVSPYDALPEYVQSVMDKPFTGDFDEMVKRRAIRAGVVFNRTHYFIDKAQERGITFESLKNFETELNGRLKTGNLKVHVVMVPLTRDQLYPALAAARSISSRPW